MTMAVSSLERSESGSRSFTSLDILRLAMSGSLRVPHFQRPFVWDAADVRKLFDSLYRGFPVGTLLLWKQPAPADRVVFGGVEVEAPQTPDAFMVVDGQQRVTALVASLAPHPVRRDERFEVFFDLARQRFVGLHRGVVPPRSIPVRQALESRTLLTWLRTHGDTLEDGDFDVADELGGALRDYRIPAYVVEGDDERLLREVFDRVNSAGKPMTRAQVFHALFAHDAEPGSPASVVASLRGLGFGDVPENRVVQSLLALRGGDVQRDLRDEFGPGEDLADWYEQTERALDRSIRFLQSIGVVHELLMPSSFPLPVLAVFFHLHPDPEPTILRLLERWLWRGWGHAFGRESGQTPALRRAIRSVNPTKGHPKDAPGDYDAVRALLEHVTDAPVDDLRLGSFRTDNATVRMVLLTLAALNPLQPDGVALDVAGALTEHGPHAVGSMVPGARSDVGVRAFWLPGWPSASNVEDAVLASHGAPPEAIAALRAGDLSSFAGARGRHLAKLTLERVNSRIAPGKRTVPPISDLLIPDPRDGDT